MGRRDARDIVGDLEPVVDAADTAEARKEIAAVTASGDVKAYIMDLIEATRGSARTACGVSARGTLALYKAATISAAMEGRGYVIPEDVKKEAVPVLAHRMLTAPGSHQDTARIMEKILIETKVPMENV